MLGIELFGSIDEAKASWRTAEQSCIGYGFSSFAWLSVWQEVVGAIEGVKPYIARVSDGEGGTVMMVPLGLYRLRGCSALGFLGGDLADYHAPILCPDFARHIDDAGFLELWQEILRRLPPFDLVSFTRMPQRIEGIQNPFVRLAGARHTADSYFSVLEGSFADFQRRRRGDLRRDTARKRRRLAEIGAVSFRVAHGPAEIEECVEALMQQRAAQGRDPSYGKATRVPAYRTFYRRMALEHGGSGSIHVCALYVGDKITATHWGMVYLNRFYWLMPGYEQGRWSQYSPGRLLLECLVEWCYANGITVFDLTIGDEQYKRGWSDQKMALFDLDHPRTTKGFALVTARQMASRTKQALRDHPLLFALAKRGLQVFRAP